MSALATRHSEYEAEQLGCVDIVLASDTSIVMPEVNVGLPTAISDQRPLSVGRFEPPGETTRQSLAPRTWIRQEHPTGYPLYWQLSGDFSQSQKEFAITRTATFAAGCDRDSQENA